jgi:hypothetical protein
VDDRKTPISSHDLCEPAGADAAPIAQCVRSFTDAEHKFAVPTSNQAERLPANPPRENSFVVFCGDAQRVSEGFAIALRAMGIEGHDELPTNNQNKEDH